MDELRAFTRLHPASELAGVLGAIDVLTREPTRGVPRNTISGSERGTPRGYWAALTMSGCVMMVPIPSDALREITTDTSTDDMLTGRMLCSSCGSMPDCAAMLLAVGTPGPKASGKCRILL